MNGYVRGLIPVLAGAALFTGACTSAGNAAPHPADRRACTTDLNDPRIHAAVDTLAPVVPQGDPGERWNWDNQVSSFYGNYNSCSALSGVVVTIERATASSPEQLLLFHNGDYVGPAAPDPNAFITIDNARSKPDTVAVTYKIPGSCNACADGTYIPVTYRWNGTEVVRTGEPPHL